MIADNLKSVRQRIRASCEKAGRSPDDVSLICVTKEAAIDDIKEALGLGVNIFGENRVQDAVLKYRAMGASGHWHLVGHLQTNKVREAVKVFDLIHSVDGARLVKEIDKESGKINKVQDILIQVNVSGEKTKFGMAPEDAMGFLKYISLCPNISIKGLMTIAPEVDDAQKSRPYFRALKELKDKLISSKLLAPGSQLLSMGMSNDFEVAIEEGSNMVRIGRAIFGDRDSPDRR